MWDIYGVIELSKNSCCAENCPEVHEKMILNRISAKSAELLDF